MFLKVYVRFGDYGCLAKFTSYVPLTKLYLCRFLKGFEMKIASTSLALILGAFVTFGSAAQIQGFVSGFAPGAIDIKKEMKSGDSDSKLHSDFVWGLGAEYLVNPVGPLVVGGGLGFLSMQQNGHDNVVMPSVPLFASIGVIGPENNVARPYFEARVGYPIPASSLKSWWNKPVNYFVGASVGAQLPYHMGVEVNCMYLSMNQYFERSDVNFRLNSLKFGGSITVHFDLFKSAESGKTPVAQPVVENAPAVESYDVETSHDTNESSESSVYDVSYGESNDQPAEEPAVEPAVETASEETSSEVSDESSEVAPQDDESSTAEETVAEESAEAAEEAPVEEAAAEAPAEEPKAEPAPAPEKKAAKKAPAKKKAAKKPAKKKAAKKPAKKPAKKAPAKKKK